MSGAEILATAVANLTDDASLESSALINLMMLAAIALIVGVLATMSPRPGVILIAAVSSLAAIFAAALLRVGVGIILVIPVITAVGRTRVRFPDDGGRS